MHLFNAMHGTLIYKEQKRAVDAARPLHVGRVHSSSYLATAADGLN